MSSAAFSTRSASASRLPAPEPQRPHHGLQRIGARVAHLVDAVAEAHQPVAARQRPGEPGLGVAGLGDGVEHVEHRSGRAAVQRALQGAEPGDRRRDQAGPGGSDDPDREGRGIEPVFADRRQIGVQRAHCRASGGGARQHPQHVGGLAGFAIGRQRHLAAPEADDGRRQHCRRGQQATAPSPDRRRPAINASPARNASTGGSEAIVSRCGRSRWKTARRAMPIAAASSSPAGMSSKNPSQQQCSGRFGGGVARQFLDRHAANDQAAIGAVDIRQHGFGGNHIIEARHGLSPSSFGSDV